MPRRSATAGKQEVLRTLTAILRGDITDWSVRKTAEGEEAVPLPPKVGDRIKAAELISRYRGLFNGEETEAPKTAVLGEIEAALERLAQP